MLPILLTVFSFLNQQTNNTNTMVLQPPIGATAAVVTMDHTFYSDRLWEAGADTLDPPSFFTMDLALRCGWRLQNAFGLTLGSTRNIFHTFQSGPCGIYDGIFDGMGPSGDQDNDVVNSQTTTVIPLSMIPGNILTLRSDARSNADTTIIVPGLTPGSNINVIIQVAFQTRSSAIVNISYQ